MEIKSLLESANPFNSRQGEAARLAGKWKKTGLLEGISNEVESNNMAMLLENQAKQLMKEANETSGFTSFSGNVGPQEQWAGVALPLVRRVFGEIVAKDLVSVQPMNLPSGLIFYLDFKYGGSQPRFTQNGSLYGASTDLKTNQPDAAKSGLYGAGRFGYSINETSSAALSIATATSATEYTTASIDLGTLAGLAAVNYDTEFSASVGSGTLFTIAVATASLNNFDVEGIRAFDLSGSALVNAVYPQFTKLNGGNVEFVVSASGTGLSATNVQIDYHKQPDAYDTDAGAVRGDFEDRDGATAPAAGSGNVSTLDIPTIDVKLRSDSVTAKTRKLKAQWTPEFAQDLNAYHSIDAEAELTSILSEYISMEIDLELLDMLILDADTTEYWNAKVGLDFEGATDGGAAGSLYYTKMSWFQTLGIKLQKVSNLIHQKTLRGGANFMVVSPKVSTILESIPGFAADSVGDKGKYAMGVQKIGSMNSRYTVYKNPYMTENVILMGYKGNQFLETGAVFAPYVPLIMTPLVYDPESFTPRKGIMTRYAKKMVRPDFYGKVYVRGLENI